MDSIIKLHNYMKAWKYHSSFENLDRKYLMPFFTLQTEYGEGGKGYSKMVMDVELTDQGKDADNQLQSSGEEDNFEYDSKESDDVKFATCKKRIDGSTSANPTMPND